MENIRAGFTYKAVEHDPLEYHEAVLCLGNLVHQICNVIQRLHSSKLCHLDIQLKNICFDNHYDLCFIDMDRCQSPNAVGGSSIYPGSCMYQSSLGGKEMDWLQLGCLILWCLTGGSGSDYHKQTTSVDHDIVHSPFFFFLIMG